MPIAYTDNVNVSNNNKDVEIYKVFDGFVGIKLENGINDIKITYSKSGLIPAIFIFMLGIILLFSILILEKNDRINMLYDNKYIRNISFYSVIGLALILFVVLYIFPMIFYISGLY